MERYALNLTGAIYGWEVKETSNATAGQ